jgi:hypothetical protein
MLAERLGVRERHLKAPLARASHPLRLALPTVHQSHEATALL